MSGKIKLLLADDHRLLTAGLKMAIDTWEEFEVSGIASDGRETVELCTRIMPDIVLMDMQMPEISGAEAARMIKSEHPEIKVVALTTFDDGQTVSDALKSGCDGFLLKVISPEQLRVSLHAVIDGVNVIDSEVMEQLRRREEMKNRCDFSERELAIIQYICRGYSNKEIAEKLSLQPGTVKNIVSLLLNKTFCVSRTDLTRYALENKIVEHDAK